MTKAKHPKKSIFKKIVSFLHLYLGLVVGIVIVILGITGCILAFEREIENTFQSYRHSTVNTQGENSTIKPSEISKSVALVVPNKPIKSIEYQKGENIIVSLFERGPKGYYYQVFVDANTGKVVKVKDMSREFFRIIIGIHYYLLLPPKIGQPIVAISTLLFFVLLVTGIILWWPKNKAMRPQRFKVKWNAKWKRLNYDLHSVMGFYATWIAIFITITGLVMGFKWVAKSIYFVNSGGKSIPAFVAPKIDSTIQDSSYTAAQAIDQLYIGYQSFLNQPNTSISLSSDDNHVVTVSINPRTGTYYKRSSYYFDDRNLKPLPETGYAFIYEKTNFADKVYRMNYDIHVGAIAGLPGKLLAFFASLVTASLPITGFIYWRGRKKKHKSKKQVVA